jgi:hypothetical protein
VFICGNVHVESFAELLKERKELREDPVLRREVLKYKIVSFENWPTGSIFEESTFDEARFR